ncbi:hypothetical protein RJ640_026186, partial [Escallonia rubra]
MAKLLMFLVLVILSFAFTCTAKVYTVGDSSGWDISTDLDSWNNDKRFVVGDVLLFQYSSTHTVDEVRREDYQGCNTTNVLQNTSSNGNTSVPLTAPGDRYFVCGNKLHCLGGMKLHVIVESDQAAASPASAPQAKSGGAFPTPSSKSNNPSAANSAMSIHVGLEYLFLAFLGFMATLSWV